MAKRKAKPKATGASKSVASLREDVGKGTGGDVKKAAKGITSSNKSTKRAATRAAKRLASRAGAVGAAAAAGHAIGSAIEKKTGIGKKIGSFAAGIRNDLVRNKKAVQGKKTPNEKIGNALNKLARAATGEGVRKALRKKK